MLNETESETFQFYLYQKTVTLLKESHELISHHVATNYNLQQNNEILSKSLSEVTGQCNSLQEKYEKATKQVETQKAECKQNLQENNLKVSCLLT